MPASRSPFSSGGTSARGASGSTATKTSTAGAAAVGDAFVLDRDQQPLDPGAEADARRGRPADLLDEVVVAAAAGDGRVLVVHRADELPRRARVVVEPAHQRRHELVGHPRRIEIGADRGEVRRARLAERVADLRRVLEQRAGALVLDVEDAERARPQLLPCLLAELVRVLLEPRGQLLDVGGTALAAADRVQLQAVVPDPEPAQKRVVELDDLGVDRGIVGPDRLDGELPVLAVAPTAGGAVPVHRPDRVELLRLRLAVQAVLDVGARDRRRALRAQGQRPVGAVGERVHLLLDDVRALPGRAQEELRVLEHGRLDRPVAVERSQPLHLARDTPPERLLGREDVVSPAGPLDLHDVRSSARNGLPASSSPSVVAGPCPEKTIVSGG